MNANAIFSTESFYYITFPSWPPGNPLSSLAPFLTRRSCAKRVWLVSCYCLGKDIHSNYYLTRPLKGSSDQSLLLYHWLETCLWEGQHCSYHQFSHLKQWLHNKNSKDIAVRILCLNNTGPSITHTFPSFLRQHLCVVTKFFRREGDYERRGPDIICPRC